MKNTHRCPKCGQQSICRIPEQPGRYASGNNIYTSKLTLFGKIPVIRYVCLHCGYVEDWIEHESELNAIRQTFIGNR